MIIIKHRGNFNNTERFLKKPRAYYARILERYGKQGVSALASATPVDSGETANAWDYEVKTTGNSFVLCWTNSNIVNGVPIAIIIQYGHGTRNGGYVQGRDYINPAIRPIFDKISQELWAEVTK